MAERTRRPESELINEALAGYLEAERDYVQVLGQRIAAADRGDYVDFLAVVHTSRRWPFPR